MTCTLVSELAGGGIFGKVSCLCLRDQGRVLEPHHRLVPDRELKNAHGG